MKAIKIDGCRGCPKRRKKSYCQGLEWRLEDMITNLDEIHPSCPLSDWPTMTVKQVSAMFDHAIGIIGEGRGTQFIVDCLRARGVEIIEKKL